MNTPWIRTPLLAAVTAVSLSLGCVGEEPAPTDAGPSEPEPTGPWAEYDIEAPSDALGTLLNDTPFLSYDRVCVAVADLERTPVDPSAVETDADGTEVVCAWNLFSGNVPEGLYFNDVASCDGPFTQGPSWFTKPRRIFTSDDSLADDADYVRELTWVADQIHASGCACCHDSALNSGNVSGFDVNAPFPWTDTMTNAQLSMGTGQFDDHLLFGHIDPDDNHGFDRTQTLFASNDPMRMRAFFQSEFDRRGGDQDDLDEAQRQFDALFGRTREEAGECISPFEGIEDGKMVWNGDEVRQLYITEVGTTNPGFPPNLDLPENTVWAIYVDDDGAGIASGDLAIGDVPTGSTQVMPTDGSAPMLEIGRTYRMYAAPDFMRNNEANCTFVYAPSMSE